MMQKGNSNKMAPMKVKDLFKGFKCISQMFDEDEAEMQIGLPTDVKHVAHIGLDGPSAESPGWMKGFESSGEGDEEVQLQQPNIPKMRRVSSPKKAKSSRQSSKHQSKDSKTTQSTEDGGVAASDSSAGEPPKKSRRKKSRDSSGSSRSTRSRGSRDSRGSSGSGSGLPTFSCSDQECCFEPNSRKLL